MLPPEIAVLPDGKHRIVCPQCHGGSGKERSLSVSLGQGTALWYCFRAGCDYKGRRGDAMVLWSDGFSAKAEDKDIPGYIRLPIYDNESTCRGWEYRAKDKRAHPKSKLNTDGDWCNLHFPSRITHSPVLLVEDRASAEAMNLYYPTVALLGVHLSHKKIVYFYEQGITCGIIALDADASVTAIRTMRREAFVTGIQILQKDLKNLQPHQLIEMAYNLHRKNNE